MQQDAECGWVKGCWRFMWGRMDALDEGWTHNGRLRRFGFTRLTVKEAMFGIGMVWGRSLYCLYLRRREAAP